MYILSDQCPRIEKCIQNGEGLVKMKELATKEQMYGKARLFSHLVVEPGCSIGYHIHSHETEFYYLLSGEGVYNDNGTEVVLHPGDVTATADGEGHGLVNRSGAPIELLALIVLE